MAKLWGGRFEGKTHSDVEAFTTSLGIDFRLWDADIRGSLAHAKMLTKVGVLTEKEGQAIQAGLETLRAEFAAGKVELNPSAEDIHSEIERLLVGKIGDVAGKLHTARSRNDQVVTATRLTLKEELSALGDEVKAFQRLLVQIAEKHTETILPGTTHLQPAQPVSLAHHLLAYFWMMDRDFERFHEVGRRVNQLPLGSGALAGTSFPIDRAFVAKELGFDGVCENSLDAVSDRDFIPDFLNAAALVMTHLSRLSEELILWSTPAYGFVELSDGTTTGSSMMPQKKNPDVAELIRGRTGRLTGAWVAMMTVLKGLPLSYNRDLQEDKVHLFEGLDTVRSSVRLMTLMLSEAKFNAEKMKAALVGDFSNATDLADYLAKKGMPFREAHEVTGRLVRLALERKVPLETLPYEEFRKASALIAQDIFQVLQPEAVMKARVSQGGTAPSAVKIQIEKAKARL